MDDAAELEILRNYEKILEKRKALMEESQCCYNFKKPQIEAFLRDSKKAIERNIKLNQKLATADVLYSNLESDLNLKKAKLHSLSNDYWTSIQTIFPKWYDEFLHYNSSQSSLCKSSSLPEHSHKQNLHPHTNSSKPEIIVDRSKARAPTNQHFDNSWRERADIKGVKVGKHDPTASTPEEHLTDSYKIIKDFTCTTSAKPDKETSERMQITQNSIDSRGKTSHTHGNWSRCKIKKVRYNV